MILVFLTRNSYNSEIMSARSCLLCGRPLSRWTGSGDDFCSREHRNQYRLRRSMDRLQEANKVASVMRRRENPRPLTASRLVNGGPREPRGFADARPHAVQQLTAAPCLTPAGRPHLGAARKARPLAVPTVGSACHFASPAPSTLRSTAPARMPLRLSIEAPGPQAAPPVRGAVRRRPAARSKRKLMAAPRSGGSRPAIDEIPRHLKPARVYPLGESARVQALDRAAAAKGRALRVSLAAGFRIPEWTVRPIVFSVPVPAGLRAPGLLALCAVPYGPADAPDAIPEVVEINPPEMRIPAAPSADMGGVFHWPGLMNESLAFVSHVAAHRVAAVPFTTSEEYPAKERPYEYRN